MSLEFFIYGVLYAVIGWLVIRWYSTTFAGTPPLLVGVIAIFLWPTFFMILLLLSLFDPKVALLPLSEKIFGYKSNDTP